LIQIRFLKCPSRPDPSSRPSSEAMTVHHDRRVLVPKPSPSPLVLWPHRTNFAAGHGVLRAFAEVIMFSNLLLSSSHIVQWFHFILICVEGPEELSSSSVPLQLYWWH
jgi:hypothetical protein